MVRIIFSYGQDERPRAEVIIYNDIKEIKLAPIVDSGADTTVIPQGIGEELGLIPPTEKEIRELKEERLSCADGNCIDYVVRKIKMKIDCFDFELDVCWLFNNKNSHFLLGRDIFEKFDILFKQNPAKKVIFESDKNIFNIN